MKHLFHKRDNTDVVTWYGFVFIVNTKEGTRAIVKDGEVAYM
jgi:hypothetical protein